MKSRERIYPPVEVYIWGDYACFTRPEMKVERVSYEVMTPSAGRGILESIFWKPEFSWRIREIHVLKPIRHFSLLRNEVNNRISYATAQRYTTQNGSPYYVEQDRSQRHTLCLRDVAYRIRADIHVHPDVQEDEAKYRDQFQRRVARGQCYITPYLGCREFVCQFGRSVPEEKNATLQPITAKLGRMLFDVTYEEEGRGEPHFFDAELNQGILMVPQDLYQERGGSYVS